MKKIVMILMTAIMAFSAFAADSYEVDFDDARFFREGYQLLNAREPIDVDRFFETLDESCEAQGFKLELVDSYESDEYVSRWPFKLEGNWLGCDYGFDETETTYSCYTIVDGVETHYLYKIEF